MTSKRNLSDVDIEGEIDTHAIFDALSSEFEAISKELHKELQAEVKYKRLKKFGEAQFFEATECIMESESQKTRLCFAKINILAMEAYNVIDTVISKKFEGDYHGTLKQKVLKTVLNLYSEQKNDAQEASANDKDLLLAANSEELLTDEERAVFEKLKDLSKYCAENVDNIRKQVIDMPIEESNPSSINGKKIDINLESSSVPSKALSPRMRKPNSKYATDSRVSPLRKISTANSSTLSPASKVDNTLPRKRGRPRKYAT